MHSKNTSQIVWSSTLRMEDRDFGPFDRCLYCLKPYNSLRKPTDEHIVPEFVGGRVVIEDGACEKCARHSNDYYETAVSRTTFYAYRWWSGKLKPTARGLLNIARGDATAADEAAFNVPATIENRPARFSLISMPRPLFWSGLQGYEHESIRPVFSNFSGAELTLSASFGFRMDRRSRPQAVVRYYLRGHGHDVTLQERHDMRGLPLAIAKIGYCYAVALLGFDRFDHGAIRSLLLGQRIDAATFVGGFDGDATSLPRDSLHLVHLRLHDGIWTAVVHLYASTLGVPYEVVLGPAI